MHHGLERAPWRCVTDWPGKTLRQPHDLASVDKQHTQDDALSSLPGSSFLLAAVVLKLKEGSGRERESADW